MHPFQLVSEHSLKAQRIAVLVFLLLPAFSTLAAEESDAVPKMNGITAEWIEVQAKSLPDSLGEELHKKAAELYKEALADLKIRPDWAAKALQISAPVETAPTQEDTSSSDLPESPDFNAMSISGIETWLTSKELEFEKASKKASDLQKENARRPKSYEELRSSIQTVDEALANINVEKMSLEQLSLQPEPTRAQLTGQIMRKLALEAKRSYFEVKATEFTNSGKLLTAQHDQAVVRAEHLKKLCSEGHTALSAAQQWEANLAQQRVEAIVSKAASEPKLVQEIAQEIKALGDLHAELKFPEVSKAAREEFEVLQTTNQALGHSKDRVEVYTEVASRHLRTGQLLREEAVKLPQIRAHTNQIAIRTSSLVELRAQWLDLKEDRLHLANLDAQVEKLSEKLPTFTKPEEAEHTRLTNVIRENLQFKVEFLEQLIKKYENLIGQYDQVNSEEQALITAVKDLKQKIASERVFSPSMEFLKWSDFVKGWSSFWDAPLGRTFSEMVKACRYSYETRPVQTGVRVALVLAIVLFGLICRHSLEGLRKRVRHMSATYGPTLLAMLITGLFSLTWLLPLWILGWLFQSGAADTALAESFGKALQNLTGLLWPIVFLRELCRTDGLGEGHFKWRPKMTSLVRTHLNWSIFILGILFLGTFLIEARSNNGCYEPLGRIAFSLALLVLLVLAFIVLRPKAGFYANVMSAFAPRRSGSLKHIAYLIGILIPIGLIVLANCGYYYTAVWIAALFHKTLVGLVVLILAMHLFLRLLFLARLHVTKDELDRQTEIVQKLEAQCEELEPGSQTPSEDRAAQLAELEKELRQTKAKQDEQRRELAAKTKDLTEKGRKSVQFMFYIGVLVLLWWVWADFVPSFGDLSNVRWWSATIKVEQMVTGSNGTESIVPVDKIIPIGPLHVLRMVAILIATIVFTKNAPGMLDMLLLQQGLITNEGKRYAWVNIFRCAIVTVGTVAAFIVIHLDLAKYGLIIGPFTFGLGLGAGKLVERMFYGIFIWSKPTLNKGHVISILDITGRVTEITLMETIVRDWHWREHTIPNDIVASSVVTNYTLSDSISRIDFEVGVSYNANSRQVESLLMEIAHKFQDDLDNEPAFLLRDIDPVVSFTTFGDSALMFKLMVFVPDRSRYYKLTSEINHTIKERLEEQGIEIPFPQQDIHVRSFSPEIGSDAFFAIAERMKQVERQRQDPDK